MRLRTHIKEKKKRRMTQRREQLPSGSNGYCLPQGHEALTLSAGAGAVAVPVGGSQLETLKGRSRQ